MALFHVQRAAVIFVVEAKLIDTICQARHLNGAMEGPCGFGDRGVNGYRRGNL